MQAANDLKSFEEKFPESERFDITTIGESEIKSYYPDYYYQIKKQYAYPIRGMFLEDIIEFKLKTTFKDF